ncbi:NAD-dependent epimerase/dehydratase family protein [Nocardioides conyzicola]|uniref:SDR family oxidoreductase n=1 Tax=Nocardioides conyzicola TaxID=1651781 RepID=A0ABP8Y0B0_9ACTN
MRIVVTGATGNVGTALLRHLVEHTDHEVVGIARRLPDRASGSRVAWVSTDLTDPSCQPILDSTFRGAGAVVHLAWGFQPSHDLGYLAELGVQGTRRVLSAVAAAQVPHLVHMSSVGAYSPKRGNTPVDEDYPTDGVPGSPYSQHKAQAERLLDAFSAASPDVRVTRMRPGIIGQRSAGSALLRYALPALLPARVLRLVPVLPLDGSLQIPMVHADDVADAFGRVLATGESGAFNLAAGLPVTTADIAQALGARHLQVPRRIVRGAVAGSWHARLQPIDPGWIDLAHDVPLLDCGRAERDLGWQPTHSGVAVLEEVVQPMANADSGRTPVLRPRTVLGGLSDAVRDKPVAYRRRP